MRKNLPTTYAFIDSQNVNLGVREAGWKLDYRKFRTYLSEKYNVSKAYLFIGYMPQNSDLYAFLQDSGYICVFRPTLTYKDGSTKGNCDAELVLNAMIQFQSYKKALIISGDGDFQCLAKYLYEQGKLGAIVVPNKAKFSGLLKFDIFKPYLRFISDLQTKLEYIPEKKNPRKDGTLKGKSSIGNTRSVAKLKPRVNTSNGGGRANNEK